MFNLLILTVLSSGAGTTSWYPCGPGFQPGFVDPCDPIPPGVMIPVLELLPWKEITPACHPPLPLLGGPPAAVVAPAPGFPPTGTPPPATGAPVPNPPLRGSPPPATLPDPKENRQDRKTSSSRATLQLEVLPEAQVILNGQVMKTGGQQRRLVTPELVEGVTYQYRLQVVVERAGQTHRLERTVSFRRGEVVRVSLRDDLTAAIAQQTSVTARR